MGETGVRDCLLSLSTCRGRLPGGAAEFEFDKLISIVLTFFAFLSLILSEILSVLYLCVCIDLQDRFVEVVVVALFSELIESLKLFNVDIFNSCNVGFFCIAIFWSSLAYESDEQKPKHCLT